MMKRDLLCIAVICAVSGTAYAADNGFYAGVQAGYGDSGYSANNILPTGQDAMSALNQTLVNDNNNNDPVDIWSATLSPTQVTTSSSGTGSGFAGRIFAGYQFTPYFALETGYLYLSQKITAQGEYQGSGQIVEHHWFSPDITRNTTGSFTVKNTLSGESAIDLAAKIMLPIEDTGFSPYVKAGVAFVNTDGSSNIQNVNVNAQGVPAGEIIATPADIKGYLSTDASQSSLCPEAAIGADYDLTNNLSLDASWSFIKGTHGIQDINFASVGVIYHFA